MANRITEFLRAIFNWSARSTDGRVNFWRSRIPRRTYPDSKRNPGKGSFDPEELGKFNDALKGEPDLDLRDFIVISLNSGARKSDILSMRWSDVLWEMSSWRVAAPKNGVAYEISLLPIVMQILKRRRAEIAESKPWVFPGPVEPVI